MTLNSKMKTGAAALLLCAVLIPTAYHLTRPEKPPAAGSNAGHDEPLSDKNRVVRGESDVDAGPLYEKVMALCQQDSFDAGDSALQETTRILSPLPVSQLREELFKQRDQGEPDRIAVRYQAALVRAWAKKDPRTALEYSVESAYPLGMEISSQTWASDDPSGALDWISGNEEAALKLPFDTSLNAMARLLGNSRYDDLARFLGSTDHAELAELLPENLALLTDSNVRDKLRTSIEQLPAGQREKAAGRLDKFVKIHIDSRERESP